MQNGLIVARYLENHPSVLKVLHPGTYATRCHHTKYQNIFTVKVHTIYLVGILKIYPS